MQRLYFPMFFLLSVACQDAGAPASEAAAAQSETASPTLPERAEQAPLKAAMPAQAVQPKAAEPVVQAPVNGQPTATASNPAAPAPAQPPSSSTPLPAASTSSSAAGAPAAAGASAAARASAAAGAPAPAPDATAEAKGKSPESAMRGDALTDAYAALTRGDKAAIPEVVTAIDRQSSSQPEDPYAVFYAGAFRLWQLAENLDLGSAQGVLDNLERAHELLPDDFRITGFYGLSQVIIGGIGDAALLGAGLQTLEHGVGQQSTYGHFLRATAVSTLSSTHPAFKTALSDMEGVGPDCKVEIDTEGTYHYPTDLTVSRPRVCTNDGIVPHAWEGYFASFGDIALKAGEPAERARALYRSAMTAPTYKDWPFKQLLEQRIEAAEANAAAYADANPLNDPGVWSLGGNICVGCHQK